MRFVRLALLLAISSPARFSAAQVAPGVADTTAPAPPKVKGWQRFVAKFAASDKPQFFPIPAAFSQQETGFAVSLTSLPVWRFGQDTRTRKSNARLGGWISQKGQSSLWLNHHIFTPGEKFYLLGELSYYDANYFYYGLGNDTRQQDESRIDYTAIIFNQRVLYRVAPNWFAGLQYRFTTLRNVRYGEPSEAGRANKFRTDLAQGILTAREAAGGTTSGFGPALLYDGRDNVLATYRGQYLHVHALWVGRYAGSDYTFARYQVDARHFQPLFGSPKTILALQYLGQLHTGGHVPFRELSGLGADLGGALYNNATLMRGIYEARYRDRQLMTFQAEVRRQLFWRLDGAVFGAVGQVGNQLTDFRLAGTRVAGGLGARFRLNRRDRLNVRLDYGVGSGGSSGVYFAVGEAF